MKLLNCEALEQDVCRIRFLGTAEELEAEAEAVYQRTRANMQIEGYAKGEADRAAIEKANGKEFFWFDAINALMERDVPDLLAKAIAENDLHPITAPQYELESASAEEGFVSLATLVLEPQLTIRRYTGFTARCTPSVVTEKDIDHFIQQRRRALAELAPHNGPAVKGNVVHVTYVGFCEGRAFPGGEATNQPLTLGAGRMIPGFEEAILGHKAGDDFEIRVNFPQSYAQSELAGKPAVFRTKLVDVCVRQLPALNSDFARRAGNVDTMEEYRAAVRAKLEQMRLQNAKNLARSKLVSQLGDESEGALPQRLTDPAYLNQLQEVQQQLATMHKPLEVYLKEVGQSKEQFLEQMRAAAERQMRVRIALLKIARLEKLEPTEQEVDEAVEKAAQRARKTVREYLSDTPRYLVRHNLSAQRAADFVVEHGAIQQG